MQSHALLQACSKHCSFWSHCLLLASSAEVLGKELVCWWEVIIQMTLCCLCCDTGILASKERASEKRCESAEDLNAESLGLENLVKVSSL